MGSNDGGARVRAHGRLGGTAEQPTVVAAYFFAGRVDTSPSEFIT